MRVGDIKFSTGNGQWANGELFKPRSATTVEPAPLIFGMALITDTVIDLPID